MPGEAQPLFSNQAIVDAQGFPTQYFIRWAQQRQVDITAGITAVDAQQLIDDWAADRRIIAGTGLTGGGFLSSDVTLEAENPGGFGTVDYTDNDVGTSLALTAATWTQIERNLSISAANFNLPKAPWNNFSFYSNTDHLIRARAVGDIYLFNFSYKITPTVANATVRFAIQPVGYPAFQFGTGAVVLDVDAGVQSTDDVLFFQQARTRFVANGGGLWVRLSCDGTLDEFSPEITPLGYQP